MVLESIPIASQYLAPVLSSHAFIVDLVFLLGLSVAAGAFVLPVISGLRSALGFFLRPSKNLKRFGKWAVITGATDGIGKAYAEELARKGLSVVLISRTQSRLDETAKHIAEKYKVETKTIAVDFNTLSPSVNAALKEQLGDLEIGVLVNNVGVSYDFPAYFHELSEEELWRLIQVNIASVTFVTHLILPGMLSRKKGAIVNISSFSAMRPTPLLTVYSAAKAYVDYFSRALELEYAPKGIHVQSVLPLLVTSKLSKVRSPSVTVPSATAYARQAVASIGYEARTLGYWSHALQNWVFGLLPPTLLDKLVLGHHVSLRARALKKKQQQQSGSASDKKKD